MERNKGHIDEGTLHAWLDGALAPEESARVEAHVASCAACGAGAAEARGLVAASSRILTALDDVPGGVAPGGSLAGVRFNASRSRASTERRRRLWTGWPVRVAAGVLFVVAGSLAVMQQMGTGERRREVQASSPPPRDTFSGVPAAAPAPAFAPALKLPVPRKPAAKKQEALATAPSAPAPVMITGRVVSAKTGEPVAGAQVGVANSPARTLTDSTGGYALELPKQQAADQPAKLTARRIGFEQKLDSITIVRAAPRDTVRHDIAMAPDARQLDQVVVTGSAQAAAPASRGVAGGISGLVARKRPPIPAGCYAIDAPGLPSQVQLGPTVRILSPDSAVFPTRYWMLAENDSVRIILRDTSGMTQQITAQMRDAGLRGQVTRSDSAGAKPFVATRTPCP